MRRPMARASMKRAFGASVLLGLVCLVTACAPIPAQRPSAEDAPGQGGTARTCTKDQDCEKAWSCWVRIPRGPMAGVRGSEEAPGACWSIEVIQQMQ